MIQLTRRHFLTAFGGSTLAGSLLGSWPFELDRDQDTGPERFYDLTAQWTETTLDGTRVRLRSYNGEIPGPLLETRPGETLRIRVRNQLTPYDSSAWNGDHNVPHMLNTTNLHLHGLEIMPHLFQPVGTSDPTAEMIAIRPGEEL